MRVLDILMSIQLSNLPERCRICASLHSLEIKKFKERMFGRQDEFTYATCSACNSLTIVETPSNLDEYYPPEYYSYNSGGGEPFNLLKRYLVRQFRAYCIWRRNLFGRFLSRFVPDNSVFSFLWEARPAKTASILDVGSGDGAFLRALSNLGFERLTGVDPFIDAPIKTTK